MKLFMYSVLLAALCWQGKAQANDGWRVETFTLNSEVLADNKIDLNTTQEIWIWLPPDYDTSKERYPVIDYIHNYGWSAKQMHEQEHVGDVFRRAWQRGKSTEFIFVVGDYRATHTPGTFCGNNPLVGRWWDYLTEELVPAVDDRYRTVPNKKARGLSGDFIGGYCALRVAMERPGVFSSVYAMHPVGTGRGNGNLTTYPDWLQLNTATSYDFLKDTDDFTQAFLLMAQSHAPDLDRPPFYADFMVKLKDGELVEDPLTIARIRSEFMLANRVAGAVDPLKQLHGLMLDWGRLDPNFDHVKGNREFTRVLDEYKIPHFAEEFRGTEWSEKWIAYFCQL